MSGQATATTGSNQVTATSAIPAPSASLQAVWDTSTDPDKNTFVDANSFEIITFLEDSANASAVIARMTSPVIAEEAAISKFVTGLGDIWDNFISEFAHYGLQTETNALTGWKQKTQTAVNAPTHTPGTGYTYNGTTQHLRTSWIPATDGGTLYTKDDALYGCFIDTISTQNGVYLGGFDNPGGGNAISALEWISPTQFWRINGASTTGASTVSTVYTNNSLYTSERNASNSVDFYKNSALVTAGTQASTDISGVEFYVGARNSNGSPSLYVDATITAIVMGKGIGFPQFTFACALATLNADLAAI